MASARQIKTPWTAGHQNDPRADQPCQLTRTPSTTSTNKRWQWRTQAEHSRIKSGPPLMRRLGIHKNIPVSGTKLTLGLRVGFISSHLTADKLFSVNPRAITGPPKTSLVLEAKNMPALIIKPRFILGLLQWTQQQEDPITHECINRKIPSHMSAATGRSHHTRMQQQEDPITHKCINRKIPSHTNASTGSSHHTLMQQQEVPITLECSNRKFPSHSNAATGRSHHGRVERSKYSDQFHLKFVKYLFRGKQNYNIFYQ